MKKIRRSALICIVTLFGLAACSNKLTGSALNDTSSTSQAVTDAVVTIDHDQHMESPFYYCSPLRFDEWANLADPEHSRVLTQSDMEKLSLDMPIDQVFDVIGPPAKAFLTNGHFDYMYWNTEQGTMLRLSWHALDESNGNDICAIFGGAIQYDNRVEFFIGGNEVIYFNPTDDPNYTEAQKNAEVPQT